jgi:acetoin utilization protein AcuB
MKPRSIDQAEVVADVMTRSVVTLFEEDDLDHIDEAMEKFRFRHVPVVDDGKLVGLVTRSDLRGVSSSSLDPTGPARDEVLKKRLFVREVMTTDVRTAHPETPILEAARLMRDAKIGCLPVVESGDRLVGIITSTDMLDLVANMLDRTARPRIPRPEPRRPRTPATQARRFQGSTR